MLINESNWQKLMWSLLWARCRRCRKELATHSALKQKNLVGPKGHGDNFNTSSNFKNNQEEGGTS